MISHLTDIQHQANDPVAVVTGTGENIGQAIAGRLRRDGFRIVGTVYDADPLRGPGAPARVGLDEGRRIGEKQGWDVAWCDLADDDACLGLIDLVRSRYGRLDCIVHNAATWTYGQALSVEDADWHRVYDVSVLGFVRLVRHGLRLLRASPSARVVALSSIAAELSGYAVAPYSAAKAAVSSAVRSLALELAPEGILVNAVAPGFIETSTNTEFDDPDSLRKRVGIIPLGRAGTPEEVAHVVAFLASPELGFVTGTIVRIDGGQLAGGPR
jgi:NAD(P)-dependent dehydrogenase (short-subunit alcohol dehydrogenase family)